MPDRSRGNVRLTVLKNRPWGILGVVMSSVLMKTLGKLN